MEGEGYFQFEDGSKYSGSWKDGEQEGTGKLEQPNGDWEVAHWKEGERHGEGAFFTAAKDKYFRQVWLDGEMTKFYPSTKEKIESLFDIQI